MIDYQLLEDRAVLVVRPVSALAAADFLMLAAKVEPFVRVRGGLRGILIDGEAFAGWQNLDGLVAHLRFVREHHRNVARVAILTDGQALSLAPRIAQHLLSAEVRGFRLSQRAGALNWLCEGKRAPAD